MQVVGVGGGGSNAVNRMKEGKLQGVEFWVVNTDAQVPRRSPVTPSMHIKTCMTTTSSISAAVHPPTAYATGA
jgi:cell division protein FtsZ